MRRNGRIVSAFVMAACALTCTASFAGTKVKIIYTAAPPYLASFVAQDQGFFAKNGLDVVLELVANGSVITQSLVSGGAEIGGPTATVLLQADEAGLDMVALAAAEKFPTPYRLGLLAREGSNVASPASLAGKTIGVPGLNGVIDVMVRKFLAANGVDEKKVKRVELAFAQMGDALKSGQVDVVATADPFFSRIVDSKLGYPAGAFADVVPAGTVAAVYAATRKWTVAHADAVKAFRQSLSEATEFIRERNSRRRSATEPCQVHEATASGRRHPGLSDRPRAGSYAGKSPVLDRRCQRAGHDREEGGCEVADRALKDGSGSHTHLKQGTKSKQKKS